MLRQWNASNGDQTAIFQAHTNLVYSIAWSPGFKKLASASLDGSVVIWDTATAGVIRLFASPGDYAYEAAWPPDGSLLAAAFLYRPIRIWSSDSGALLLELAVHHPLVN